MKRLFLVRHAKAVIGNPSILDHDRKISADGIRDIKKISYYLKNNNLNPDHIISSTSIRTLETINILNETIHGKIYTDPLLYNAHVIDVEKIIKDMPDKYDSLMIIGHNPSMTNLINKISNINIDYLPTSGIGIVDFNSSWNSINNNGILFDFICPKKLNQI
ncbi:histidine phosphatase family protein [Candidatus Marinimicrobia bacterium]|nr:histidine phosphatase family protein [Candidatus Neomarinimicrobiota bacterium]